MSDHEIIFMVVQFLLTGGIGVITFFLKRTIDDIADIKSNYADIQRDYISRDEFDKCRIDITEVKQNYLTKEDFYREQLKTETKLDKIMDILMEMKGDGR